MVPPHNLEQYGRRSFSCAGPTLWIALPDLRSTECMNKLGIIFICNCILRKAAFSKYLFFLIILLHILYKLCLTMCKITLRLEHSTWVVAMYLSWRRSLFHIDFFTTYFLFSWKRYYTNGISSPMSKIQCSSWSQFKAMNLLYLNQ